MKHTVTLAPDRTAFQAAEDETILQAARRQSLNLPHSCQNGICGQCKAQVLSGDVWQGEHAEQALSAEEAAQGKILMCCSRARSDVHLKVPGYNGASMPPVKTLPARVASVTLIHDTAVVRLDLPKAPPFAFLAGQYIDILLKDGQSRSYSIASDPAQNGQIELHIRRRNHGLFSEMLFGEAAAVREKAILRLRGPLGTFVLQESSRPLLLLATGTGFAPVCSILHQLIRQDPQRPLHLYWGARHRHDLYLQDEAAALTARLPNARFSAVLSQPDADWTGETGYVQHLALRDYTDLSGHQVYACGSPQMTTAARELLCSQGRLNPEDFFSDAFSAAV